MRKEKVRETAREIIENGSRPSARRIAEELSWGLEDVHRCLNALERDKEVETYSREVLGQRHRFVGVKR